MSRRILFATLISFTLSLLAHADPKADVQAAAKKLAAADGYSWKSTTEGGQGRGAGSAEGKTQKDGLVMLSITRQDNTIEVFLKDGKGAVKTADGWKSLAEASQDTGQQNPGRFIARMVRNLKAPALQAEDLAGKAKELAKSEDAYSGDLTEEGAKELLAFGRRGGDANANAPQVSNAKGNVKFWLKDGQLSKMETHVEGSVNFNGQDRDVNRTTTVEIKDVGSTKIELPAEAKAKME
jgi:hypothetical protein